MKKPSNGTIHHQDTDETKVLTILSLIILGLTILTIGSYAENLDPKTDQKLASEKQTPTAKITQQNKSNAFLLNTSDLREKTIEKNTLTM